MEIQQNLKLNINKNTNNKKWVGAKMETSTEEQITTTTKTTTPKQKWKNIIFFNTFVSSKPKTQNPPEEFLCPISGSLMSDPVIVSSGHSFDRISIQACKNLNFTPQLPDGTTPNFKTLIPNLALKSSILKWSQTQSQTKIQTQTNPNLENIIRMLISSQRYQSNQNDVVSQKNNSAETKPPPSPPSPPPPPLIHSYSSSGESIATATSSSTPPPPPLQYSSASSSEIEPSTTLEEIEEREKEILVKLRNSQPLIIEEALISLRKLTRTKEETRVYFCTNRILNSLRFLISSSNDVVRVNAIATIVNLSLEKTNKVKIVRSGIVPPLIDILKFGSSASQELASGALFSLSLDEDNKTAIGVLGALLPLLHALRSDSERTRHDAALALYHLSLVRSNRAKMVKLGFVSVLLGMVKTSYMMSRVLMILGNLGSGSDGRAVMLDAGVVECLVGLLSGTELGVGSTRESCVGVLYALSHGGLRFRAVAKEVGMVEVLQKMEKLESEKGNEKVRRILEVMREKEVEEEEIDWEELLDSGLGCRTLSRLGSGVDNSSVNSLES